jgi:subfamily B ATP-binding cassette protein MsbA
MLLLAIIFMFTLSWQLALASVFLVGLFQWLSLRVFIPQIQKLAAKNRRLFANVSLRLSENLSALRDIQLFGQEERTAQTFERELHGMANEVTQHNVLTVNNVAVFYLLQGLGLALIYGVGAYGAVFQNYDLGLLVSFAGFFSQFVAPITAFGNALGSFQSSLVSLHRVFRLIDVEAEISEKPNALKAERFKGHIKFEDVGFSYEYSTHAWRMKHLTFEILPGEKVAIVGGSGTGKTTILNLLTRFYDVTEGCITIDGHDVRDLTLASLRNNFGWVAQNVMLFQDTIANNIRFAKADATPAEILKAAAVGHVPEFADQLPQGFETMLGERGEGLSGGQKQRISIARAALSDPSILLLDEATSALDNRSQALIMRSIDVLTRERTSLNIAHRLNTIVNADKIIVLGFAEANYVTIKGIGTHDQLLETCEEYYKLYNLKLEKKAILMPIGPMYNTTPVLPTVIGLAAAYSAPVYVLNFGDISHEDLHTGRFGIQTGYAHVNADEINSAHHDRVAEIIRVLRGEGITADMITARVGDSWISSTINAIDTLHATHVVAMDNVLIPLSELRNSIQTIERKATVDYILVNPLVAVME